MLVPRAPETGVNIELKDRITVPGAIFVFGISQNTDPVYSLAVLEDTTGKGIEEQVTVDEPPPAVGTTRMGVAVGLKNAILQARQRSSEE